jgi:hypothetical protein
MRGTYQKRHCVSYAFLTIPYPTQSRHREQFFCLLSDPKLWRAYSYSKCTALVRCVLNVQAIRRQQAEYLSPLQDADEDHNVSSGPQHRVLQLVYPRTANVQALLVTAPAEGAADARFWQQLL